MTVKDECVSLNNSCESPTQIWFEFFRNGENREIIEKIRGFHVRYLIKTG